MHVTVLLPRLPVSTHCALLQVTKGAPHIIADLVDIDKEEVVKRVNWKVHAWGCGLCASAGAGGGGQACGWTR